jgi:hypothetical protein
MHYHRYHHTQTQLQEKAYTVWGAFFCEWRGRVHLPFSIINILIPTPCSGGVHRSGRLLCEGEGFVQCIVPSRPCCCIRPPTSGRRCTHINHTTTTCITHTHHHTPPPHSNNNTRIHDPIIRIRSTNASLTLNRQRCIFCMKKRTPPLYRCSCSRPSMYRLV